MDRIMPIDLENARPRKSLRGYDTQEVHSLLNGAARTMEVLLAENGSLREQTERLRVELERFRNDERALKDALISAQRAADETRETANRQASLIVEEARQSALAERIAVQQKVSELRWDIERLRIERERFMNEFRTFLERQLREVDVLTPLAVVETETTAATA